MQRDVRRPVILIAIVSIALGLLASALAARFVPVETRAKWMSAAGKHAAAEALYWDELQKGRVTVPTVLAFLEAHERAAATALFTKDEPPVASGKAKPREAALPEAVVDGFVRRNDLPREVALVARVVRFGGTDEGLAAHEELEDEAARDPPMPWANHVLARESWAHGDLGAAAKHFEREARAHGRAEDVESLLAVHLQQGDLSALARALDDPQLGPRAPAWMQLRYAMQLRDHRRALRWLLPASFPRPTLGPLILAAIAASAWFAFCARLGQLRARPKLRVPLHLAAFALGVASIAPTTYLIEWQEVVLHLKPTGDVVRDAAFFVLGVGFREEASKLLLFAPLVPILRRYGSPIDVVACGALVGLGFAAAENLQYFARDDLSSALARFLTANFLHMSMTGIAAAAFTRIGKKDDGFYEFTVAFLTVVALHGVYDFFIVSPAVSELSFLSMTVFVVLARNFVFEMHDARLRVGRSKPLLPVFALGTATVTGASFVYAAALIGPVRAAEVMFLGLLGVAILVIVFVKQLRHL